MSFFQQSCCRTGSLNGESQICEDENLSAAQPYWTAADFRRRPRFNLEVDVAIHSRTCDMLMGRSVDISESGMAAMLTIEALLGEVGELGLMLHYGPMMIHATVSPEECFSARLRVRRLSPHTNSFAAHAVIWP
jgi:hypothetical protein